MITANCSSIHRWIAAAAFAVACFTLCPTALMGETSTTRNVRIEKVADGLVFPEGPVWLPEGYLVFSDVQDAKIVRIKPGGGTDVWLDKGMKTNGLILSNDKQAIYACCSSDLKMLRIDLRTSEIKVLASDYKGRKFNDVNDVAVDAKGNIFFTDPKWSAKPDDVQAVYRISPDGNVEMAATIDRQPNGIVVSPDQKWIYVGRTGGSDIWRFGLGPGGEMLDGAQWVKLEPGAGPDGMTIDRKGNLYVAQAGNGKITVVSPEGQTLQQVKVFERMATNCEFQGDNQNVLYVTGDGTKNGKRLGAVYKLTFE